jgi:unsaturated chondroitin disaccharide hydrolase
MGQVNVPYHWPRTAAHWRSFGDRLLNGLLCDCDLKHDQALLDLISQGASHVCLGFGNNH